MQMSDDNGQRHTRRGIEMLRVLYQNGKRMFTSRDARKAAPSCGMSAQYVTEALHLLVQDGWIIRYRNGLFGIAPSFPGMTPIHEFEIAMALTTPAAISHWSALHFHGMTEQIPRTVFITTVREQEKKNGKNIQNRSHTEKINGIKYSIFAVKAERFFGTKKYWVGETRVNITDPERTLIDGLITPKYFGGWAEVYTAFINHFSDISLDRIIEYALRLDAAVAKRLGWILERQKVDDTILQPLIDLPINGYRPLDPHGPRKGHCDKKWHIQINLPGEIAS